MKVLAGDVSPAAVWKLVLCLASPLSPGHGAPLFTFREGESLHDAARSFTLLLAPPNQGALRCPPPGP
jgi:hypothetical protein